MPPPSFPHSPPPPPPPPPTTGEEEVEEEESEEEEEVRLCSPPAYVSPRPDCALVSVFGAPLWRLTPRIFALARLLQ